MKGIRSLAMPQERNETIFLVSKFMHVTTILDFFLTWLFASCCVYYIRLSGFRLTQHCFNSCLLFYSFMHLYSRYVLRSGTLAKSQSVGQSVRAQIGNVGQVVFSRTVGTCLDLERWPSHSRYVLRYGTLAK
jgi:hypothetical protein